MILLTFIDILIIGNFLNIIVSPQIVYEQDIDTHLNVSDFLRDLALGLQTNGFTIVNGKSNSSLICETFQLNKKLHNIGVVTTLFTNYDNNTSKLYFNYLSKSMENYLDVNTLFVCYTLDCSEVIRELRIKNVIRRNFLYIFYWGDLKIDETFKSLIHEAMKVLIITYPRPGVLYYNQATSETLETMPLVNWWSGRMYRSPALPLAQKVYDNFNNRIFKVPVLHVPPWHFVKHFNDTNIQVIGGRDHQLLSLMAEKLNFKYEYFDPPDHSQGSGVTKNGSFKGVLGLIYRREADFFLGDVTMTWERQGGVEFSFFTLADSGAFLTHAPRRLSETLALLRPFRWEVWPAVVASVVVAGPALWAAAAGAALWRPRRAPIPPSLPACVWFTTSIFLRQSGRVPSSNVRARALTLLLSLASTYVLCDVYSATLTSLLARPGREPPLTDLFSLERAMKHDGYSLLIERHSSSEAILKNGTGVYGRLWNLMERQRSVLVRSVEQGVRKMLQNPGAPVALLAGRETLYFDTRRFGASNFQLSEKLYTRYSAIALQLGCPYVENFNRVIMKLFEAGILTKITSEEYEKLGESGMEGSAPTGSTSIPISQGGTSPTSQSSQKLEPINMRMLQGAFYVLVLGYIVSGLILLAEIHAKKRSLANKKLGLKMPIYKKKIWSRFKREVLRLRFWMRNRWHQAIALSELSLDYIE